MIIHRTPEGQALYETRLALHMLIKTLERVVAKNSIQLTKEQQNFLDGAKHIEQKHFDPRELLR